VAGFSTVMLLNPADSTLLNFTQSNESGIFSFSNVRNMKYLLKVTCISYLPYQREIAPHSAPVNDLGLIMIKPIAKELFEVVIREARAPLYIRGDTIEYDASTFKVPTGSSVEDLLRRLPGIDVDANGNIQTQGRDVKRVYVDGKTFFGDDPKSATKNLDANAIARVQVFDEKSEQAKLTGIDDGNPEKAMNLALKDAFKKGVFGKITLAGGTLGRWAGRGNFNRFDKKSQLSFIGYANNINETGVNWEDYSEFRGKNTFSEYDNGDFGFSSSTGRYARFSSEGIPMNYFDGRGFTKNYGAGTNYNFDNNKTKCNASYFYNYTKLNFDQYTYKETFLSDSSFLNMDTTTQQKIRNSHSIATRFEQELDSNNVIIAKVNFTYNTSRTGNIEHNVFSTAGELPINALHIDNSTFADSWRLTSAMIYRLKLKKTGRTFALSAGYNNSRTDQDEDLYSLNSFAMLSYTEQIAQMIEKNNDVEQIKSSALYTEPLSRKFFWEIFYNFYRTNSRVNNHASAPFPVDERIDSLSIFYTNNVMLNRIGTDVRYSYNGLNIMLGVAAQELQMKGRYAIAEGLPLLANPVIKYYQNLMPIFTLRYQLPRNMWLSTSYGYNTTEPSFDYLQPVRNFSNPSYRIEGNPDLKPERSHDTRADFRYHNPSSFSSVMVFLRYSFTENNIGYNQRIEWVDSVGLRTTSTPANNGKANSGNVSSWIGFPIVKTVLTVNVGGNLSYAQSSAYVNDVLNKTGNLNYGGNLRFNFTPNQKLIFGLSGRAWFTNVDFSISSQQNQKIQTYNGDASVKWQFAKRFFFESNFTYEFYHNTRFRYDKNIPILNASIRALIGKKNNFEARLAAFDVFDKRQYIQQYAAANYLVRTTAETLARYFMLSISYNIKGYEARLQKDQQW
jgi:hypothetical protein